MKVASTYAWRATLVTVLTLTGMLFLGGTVLGNSSKKCSYPGTVAAGEQVYEGTCIACHGDNGKGVVPGVPDFTKRGGVLSKTHPALVAHIEKGFDSGGGLAMPPRGGNPALTDQDLANVHAYLHKAFGCG